MHKQCTNTIDFRHGQSIKLTGSFFHTAKTGATHNGDDFARSEHTVQSFVLLEIPDSYAGESEIGCRIGIRSSTLPELT